MTTVQRSEKKRAPWDSIVTGALVGLFGGALISLVEGIGAVIRAVGPPASPSAAEVGSLVLGLLFLAALAALGAGLAFAILGALLALWQVLRGVHIPRETQAALLSTVFTVSYVTFTVVDSLGIGELFDAGRQALLWALFLLCLIAGVGAAAWFLFKVLFRVRGVV